MTSQTVKIRTGYDSWVDATIRHSNDRRIRLKSTAQYDYLYHPLGPELRNKTIASAFLHIWGVGTGWGSQTLTVTRLTERWDASTLTWTNKPAAGGASATLTQTNPADPTEWVVDVTDLVAEYAAGARWYGVRLSIGSSTERVFRSLNANGRTPWLEVNFTDAPAAPVDLSPSGGLAVSLDRPTLSWSNDNSPDGTTLTAFQVQVDPAANGSAPAFNSGTVTSELAEYDLSTGGGTIVTTGGFISPFTVPFVSGASSSSFTSGVGYAGLADGASTQWRVRVRNLSQWSQWSDWAQFSRAVKGTVSITTPGTTVTEFSPPVAWTTSFAQSAWRLFVYDAADTSTPLHDSGRKSDGTQSYTIPRVDPKTGRRILVDGRDYVLEVRAWDAVDRQLTPGDPTFSRATVTFHYADDPTPNQVTSLVATQVAGTPYVELTWNRSTTPDGWTVLRDDKAINDDDIPGADLLVSGTSYKYRDKDAAPGDHTWKVKPTVNGLTAGSPTASLTVEPTGLWVLGPDDIDVLVDVYDDPFQSFAMPDRATNYDLPQGGPVRISQGTNGLRGGITGALKKDGGRTADQWADRLLKIKKRDEPVTLYLGAVVIRARIFDIVVEPSKDAGLQTRAVSFGFFQVGAIDWLD